MAWTFDDALEDVTVLERNDEWGRYEFCVGELRTKIQVHLFRSPTTEQTRFVRSHDIQTPGMLDAYHSGRVWWDYPAYALRNAVSGITQYYDQAVQAGHTPQESWLQRNDSFAEF
ncbi:hypothetical protein [Bradyrhizobium oligotrophicum]|uniref:hypothetical protein n=1 Tax=Bradyrhizobium oligotrophicum TaxID=44255 RepID=UPI003EBCA245